MPNFTWVQCKFFCSCLTASAPVYSMGLGFGQNAGKKLKTGPESFLLVIGVYLLINVFNRFLLYCPLCVCFTVGYLCTDLFMPL
ncbi:hypothetical protein GIB67_041610 [Kingdonia uniflora]|uniref:Uncharacterized protein n=1 Tax=Kingdonia uniflora TaxID=39325 RepID=A0A7J7MQD8_9MAGN|nr:hypothetical protein GIB67_041610 [Kingdonia uniflora]